MAAPWSPRWCWRWRLRDSCRSDSARSYVSSSSRVGHMVPCHGLLRWILRGSVLGFGSAPPGPGGVARRDACGWEPSVAAREVAAIAWSTIAWVVSPASAHALRWVGPWASVSEPPGPWCARSGCLTRVAVAVPRQSSPVVLAVGGCATLENGHGVASLAVGAAAAALLDAGASGSGSALASASSA